MQVRKVKRVPQEHKAMLVLKVLKELKVRAFVLLACCLSLHGSNSGAQGQNGATGAQGNAGAQGAQGAQGSCVCVACVLSESARFSMQVLKVKRVPQEHKAMLVLRELKVRAFELLACCLSLHGSQCRCARSKGYHRSTRQCWCSRCS